MRELKPHELAQVNGAGIVADLINQRLEQTFRSFGDNLGATLGESIFKGLEFISSKTNMNFDGFYSLINRIFGKK